MQSICDIIFLLKNFQLWRKHCIKTENIKLLPQKISLIFYKFFPQIFKQFHPAIGIVFNANKEFNADFDRMPQRPNMVALQPMENEQQKKIGKSPEKSGFLATLYMVFMPYDKRQNLFIFSYEIHIHIIRQKPNRIRKSFFKDKTKKKRRKFSDFRVKFLKDVSRKKNSKNFF